MIVAVIPVRSIFLAILVLITINKMIIIIIIIIIRCKGRHGSIKSASRPFCDVCHLRVDWMYVHMYIHMCREYMRVPVCTALVSVLYSVLTSVPMSGTRGARGTVQYNTRCNCLWTVAPTQLDLDLSIRGAVIFSPSADSIWKFGVVLLTVQ